MPGSDPKKQNNDDYVPINETYTSIDGDSVDNEPVNENNEPVNEQVNNSFAEDFEDVIGQLNIDEERILNEEKLEREKAQQKKDEPEIEDEKDEPIVEDKKDELVNNNQEPVKEEEVKEEEKKENGPIPINAEVAENNPNISQEIKDNLEAQEVNQEVVAASALTAAEIAVKAAIIDSTKDKDKEYTLAQLYESGKIRRANGDKYMELVEDEETDEIHEINLDTKAPDFEKQLLARIMEDITANKPVYTEHINPEDEKNSPINEIKWNKDSEDRPKVSSDVQKEFVDPDFKRNILAKLKKIHDEAQQSISPRKDSVKFREFYDKLDEKIKDLEDNAFKEDFKVNMQDLTDKAEEYHMEKIGQKPTAKRQSRLDMVQDLKIMNEEVQERKVQKTFDDAQKDFYRDEIAARFVKQYALKRKELKDPNAVQEAKLLLSDPKAFQKKVEEAKKQPFFINLYGGNDDITMARLEEDSKAPLSKVFSHVMEEVKNPTAKSKEYEEKTKDPMPLRLNSYDEKSPLTDDMKNDYAKTVLDMKKELDAIGRKGLTSPQLRKLNEELAIAKIRIESGEHFIDYRRMAAKIGDAADAYFNHKVSQVDTDTNNGLKRARIAQILRHAADSMNKGVKPSAERPDDKQLNMELLTAKIVDSQTRLLKRSEDKAERMQGDILDTNPQARLKAMQRIQNSEALKKLFDGMTEEQIDNYRKLSGDAISNNLKVATNKLYANKKKEKALEAAVKDDVVKKDEPAFAL